MYPTRSLRNRVKPVRSEHGRGRWRCEMLEQSRGGVGVRGGGADAARVNDILLQFIWQSTRQFRTRFEQYERMGYHRHFNLAPRHGANNQRSARHRLQLRLHLGLDTEPPQELLDIDPTRALSRMGNRFGIK